jgi:replicative DNA helicase
MGVKDTLPGDDAVELAVLGDMFNLTEVIPDVAALLSGSDFRNPLIGAAFDIIVAAHREGRVLDGPMLMHELDAVGRPPGPGWIADMMSSGSGAWEAHARTVIEYRVRRDGLAILHDATVALRSHADPEGVLGDLVTRVERIDHPLGRIPAGCLTLEDHLARDEEHLDEWVIPGLLRRGWRVLVVAGEGGGKSMLLRQFAVLASTGIHPLGYTPIGHCNRVLLVDLENPIGGMRRSLRNIRGAVGADFEPGNVFVWSEPRGIDINSRQGRRDLEAAIQNASPSLVLIGPAYKLYRRHGRQTDEEAVADVQAVLDDLRIRYGFATMIEHHAPHGYAGTRDMRPVGTSLWLRWPELGFGLVPEKKERPYPVLVQRWRADRDANNSWPSKLDKGDRYPWLGIWPDASWSQEQF